MTTIEFLVKGYGLLYCLLGWEVETITSSVYAVLSVGDNNWGWVCTWTM